MQGVVEGTGVSPYVADELSAAGDATAPVLASPIESHPEEYADYRLLMVKTESIEK